MRHHRNLTDPSVRGLVLSSLDVPLTLQTRSFRRQYRLRPRLYLSQAIASMQSLRVLTRLGQLLALQMKIRQDRNEPRQRVLARREYSKMSP